MTHTEKNKLSGFLFLWPLLYIVLMGVSNYFVYHNYDIEYGTSLYAIAMIPFLTVLATGSLLCLTINKDQFPLPWSGDGKLSLFLIVFLPLIGLTAFYLFTGGAQIKFFALPLVSMFLVGVAEETMFRRIVYIGLLDAFKEHRTLKPLLISAALFSLLHAVNIFAGLEFSQVLVQLFGTFIAGLFYSLMYEYTQNLYLMIAMHFLWDYLLFSDAGHNIPSFSYIMIALQIVQIILLLILFRNKRKQLQEV